jgi:hypothetical protein
MNGLKNVNNFVIVDILNSTVKVSNYLTLLLAGN